MTVLYWNARGFANEDTQRAFKKMVRSHKPRLAFVSEPFILSDDIPSSYWNSLSLKLFATNDRGLQDPNLWLLCSSDIRPALLSSTDQQITVSCCIDGVSCINSSLCKNYHQRPSKVMAGSNHYTSIACSWPMVSFGRLQLCFGST